MKYLPNSVYVEEKGVFNIVSGQKNIILPVIGMAVSGSRERSVYLTDRNTGLFEKIKELHGSLTLLQWNCPEEILPILNDNPAPVVIIEYNRYIGDGNMSRIEALGRGLHDLAKRSNGLVLMISATIDDDLRMLCEYGDRVLIIEDKNRDDGTDFVFRDRTTGYYVKRQKTIDDFL